MSDTKFIPLGQKQIFVIMDNICKDPYGNKIIN